GPQPGSTLTVIDVPARKIVRTISIAPAMRPHGIVFLPGDTLVAVTSEQMRAVVVVSLASGEVVRIAKTDKAGSHMVGVAADGRRAWTGDIGSNTVTELDLSTGTALRAITVPTQPEAINVTADGAEVWVGSNATGRVSVVSAATGAVSTAAEGMGWPYRVLFTPDQSQVFLPDYRNEEVRVLDRATRTERGRVGFPGGGPQGIAISPDGKYVFVSLSAQARVAVIRVSDRTVVGHVAAGETPDGVAYTPRVVR
ncbi:MAG: YncE family protein, partial [Gemmatimonadaceae bacterium]